MPIDEVASGRVCACSLRSRLVMIFLGWINLRSRLVMIVLGWINLIIYIFFLIFKLTIPLNEVGALQSCM